MYNFLDARLCPKASCNASPMEGYEITNLISANDRLRAQGFIAYTITKPPIEIEFELLCNVDIAYICLDTQVGNQKCTGVEVFAKYSEYVSIAKAVFDKPGVIFCNSNRYSKENQPEPAKDGSKALFFFKKDTFRVCSRAKSIKIVIFRTAFTIPCLKAAQIIGEVSKLCSKTTMQTVDELMRRQKLISWSYLGEKEISDNSTPKSDKVDKNGLTVSQDFLDDLTYEIMTNPMTLPSGKTIDRTTLDKHVSNEESFGRKPGDPFTGLNFTSTRKPIFNAALKSRIDMFLLANSNHPATFNLNRSVGTSSAKKLKFSGKCLDCNSNEEGIILYSMPCDHFYCRQCIKGIDKITCKLCCKEYSKNEIERCYS